MRNSTSPARQAGNPNGRLIARGSKILWCHRLEMQAGDTDLTDLDDRDFEAAVCRTVGVFAFAPVALVVPLSQLERAA